MSTTQKRILIVEDEALIAEEIRDRLQRLGYTVVGIADTGEMAIEIATQTQPDLVLMDIQLKGDMDGIEVAERIYTSLNIPIIYATAHSDQATLNRAKNIAQFGYILKPFQEKDLMVTIPMAIHRYDVEKQLQENQITYDTILNTINDGVIVTDKQACIRFLNPVAESLTGWRIDDQHEISAANIKLIDGQTRHALDNPFVQALQQNAEVVYSTPCILIGHGGLETPVDVSVSPMKNLAGKIVGTAAIVRNLSEQCTAERKFSSLMESVPEAMLIINAEGQIVLSNSQAEELFGYEHKALLGTLVEKLIPERMRIPHKAHRKHYLEHPSARPMGAEAGLYGLRKDDTEFPIDISLNTLNTADGVLVFCSIRDISKRKQAEARIERLNKLYATLAETNESIVRIRSRNELFANIVRIAVEFSDLACAWIGLVDEETGDLAPISVFGPCSSYVSNITVSSDSLSILGRGPSGKALHEGMHQICNDFMNDPRTIPWREAANAVGIRSSSAFPLRQQGSVIGVLTLYSKELNFFTEDIVRLLDDMTLDISIALDNFILEEQRQLAEKAVRENEMRLNLAIAASGLGIYDVHINTGERTYNSQYASMLGYESVDFHEDAESYFQRIHPDDQAGWLAAYNDCICGDRNNFRVEFRMRTATNEWKWILAIGAVVECDQQGNPLRFIGTHTDISTRKLSEAHLRLLASVFDSSHESIVITDAQLNIVAVNKACIEMTGYTTDEAIGQHVRLLKSGHHDNAYYKAMWKHIDEWGYWQGELWVRHKTGDSYPSLAAISAVHSEMGEITHYVKLAADITQHKESEQRIQQLAYYDALTGVPNRTLMREQAQKALAMAERNNAELALFFIDLDRFKNINDSLGHIFGDHLLQKVAERLSNVVRDSDTVCRLGGDEFLLLLSADSSIATHVAQKLLSFLSEPYNIAEHSLQITCSIGIGMFPKDGMTFEELLKNADIAMYKAKDSGRNSFHFFSMEMNASAMERLKLENALRLAVANNELSLHYQPQINLSNGDLIGMEALLRWQHPEMGSISPAKFIPIAEETGLIVTIGEWVLREACRQNCEWQKAGIFNVPVSVNLSIRQFSHGNILQTINNVLSETKLAASYLELEITESILVQDIENTLNILHHLKLMGVLIAVDDFGTGYSSLAYLKRFPLDRLKIDQSFVHDLVTNRDDQVIATATINLGHALSLVVIAEGVESDEQLKILRELGCDEAQGYFFGKPMPAAEIEKSQSASNIFS